MTTNDIAAARGKIREFRDSICLDIDDKDTRFLVVGNISDEDFEFACDLVSKDNGYV